MFSRLLKLPEAARTRHDLSSLEFAIHAAAPCPIPVKQQMIEWWGPVIHEYYAGTEGNGFVYCGSEQWLAHPGAVGQSLPGPVPTTPANRDYAPGFAPGPGRRRSRPTRCPARGQRDFCLIGQGESSFTRRIYLDASSHPERQSWVACITPRIPPRESGSGCLN